MQLNILLIKYKIRRFIINVFYSNIIRTSCSLFLSVHLHMQLCAQHKCILTQILTHTRALSGWLLIAVTVAVALAFWPCVCVCVFTSCANFAQLLNIFPTDPVVMPPYQRICCTI